MRTCTKCGESKDETAEFWHKDGGKLILSKCKICRTQLTAEWRLANPGRSVQIAMKWNKAHPEKVRANVKKAQIKEMKTNWPNVLVRRSRGCAVKRKRSHTITVEFVANLYERQGGRCHYTGIPFDLTHRAENPLYPSLDRIDSSKGYDPDNVVIAAWWVNRAKGTLSADEFLTLFDQASESRRLRKVA